VYHERVADRKTVTGSENADRRPAATAVAAATLNLYVAPPASPVMLALSLESEAEATTGRSALKRPARFTYGTTTKRVTALLSDRGLAQRTVALPVPAVATT
jgi:hypothetical protein